MDLHRLQVVYTVKLFLKLHMTSREHIRIITLYRIIWYGLFYFH